MAQNDKHKKLEEDMDEALDLLDDLTEEELAALEAEFDPNEKVTPQDVDVKNQDDFNPAPAKKLEEQKERMFHKRDMVAKLENVFTNNTMRGKPTDRVQPIKQWKRPEMPEYTKINKKTDTKNNDSNNNNRYNSNNNTKSKIYEKEECDTGLTAEEEELFEDLTEEDLLELAALSGTHGLLTQDQAVAFDRGGLDDDEWSSLKLTGRCSQPVKGTEKRLMSMSDENADLDATLLLKHLDEDTDDIFHIRINNVLLETTIMHAIFDALKTTTKIKHISLAAVGMKDEEGLLFNEAFEANKTLESVNLESNELTNEALEPLFKILQEHPTIREFKCAHQKHGLGSRGEEAMARALDKNERLLKISYPFKVQSARSLADRCQIRNNEILRRKRTNGEEYYNYREEVVKRDEHPQPWIKEYKQKEKNERMKADLNEQKTHMNKVPNVSRMRAEAKMRAKENAKPTMDNELASKLAAARKSRGRSMR